MSSFYWKIWNTFILLTFLEILTSLQVLVFMYSSLRPQEGLEKYQHSPEAVLNKLQGAEAPLAVNVTKGNATQYIWHKEYRNHLNNSQIMAWLNTLCAALHISPTWQPYIHPFDEGRPASGGPHAVIWFVRFSSFALISSLISSNQNFHRHKPTPSLPLVPSSSLQSRAYFTAFMQVLQFTLYKTVFTFLMFLL